MAISLIFIFVNVFGWIWEFSLPSTLFFLALFGIYESLQNMTLKVKNK